MKISIVTLLVALGALGCKTSTDNAGAPSPGYETVTGPEQPMPSHLYRDPLSWQGYRFIGITPISPP